MRLTLARLPCCIVILLRHSLAQENLHASDSGDAAAGVNCFAAAMLVLVRHPGDNFRVADDPPAMGPELPES